MSLGLTVSLVVSFLLLIFYRWDEIISGWTWIRVFSFYGMFSYSLYLIHYPMMRQAQSVILRLNLGASAWSYWLTMAVMLAVATAAGLVLYYAAERPCIRMMSRWKKTGRPSTS